MKNVVQENEKAISGAIKINEKEIQTHLDGLVWQTVENTQSGTSKRKLLTQAGNWNFPFPVCERCLLRYKSLSVIRRRKAVKDKTSSDRARKRHDIERASKKRKSRVHNFAYICF